ncbi:MAG: hypothetical protein V4692_09660 [Bdellovibrionota bacterium]
MKRNLLAMMVIAMAFGTANAQESSGATGSEYFHQAGAGASEVEAGLNYHLGSVSKAKTAAATDVKTSGLQSLYGQYQYGINEMFAVGGRIGYQATETDTTPKTKTSGLQDVAVFMEGTNAMGAGNLKFGADLGIGLAKKKVGTDTDAGTGGLSLAPYVGWDMSAGPGMLGAKLQYTWRGERKSETAGTETATKDGNTVGLSAFYEHMMADVTLGAALNFDMTADQVSTTSGVSTTSKAHNTTGIDLYSMIPFAGWSLLPGLTFDFADSEQDKYQFVTLNVAGRFAF